MSSMRTLDTLPCLLALPACLPACLTCHAPGPVGLWRDPRIVDTTRGGLTDQMEVLLKFHSPFTSISNDLAKWHRRSRRGVCGRRQQWLQIQMRWGFHGTWTVGIWKGWMVCSVTV